MAQSMLNAIEPCYGVSVWFHSLLSLAARQLPGVSNSVILYRPNPAKRWELSLFGIKALLNRILPYCIACNVLVDTKHVVWGYRQCGEYVLNRSHPLPSGGGARVRLPPSGDRWLRATGGGLF